MTLILLLLIAAMAWIFILGCGLTRAIGIPKRKTYGAAIGRGDPTSPEEAGVAGREEHWTLSDGTPSVGFLIDGKPEHEAAEALGHGLGVLIVHGFCDSRFGALRWAKMLEPFAESIAIYDQRCHGDAGGKVYRYGEKEARDALAVLDQAKQATGIDRWVILGQSAGAGIAMRAVCLSQDQEKSAPAETGAVVGLVADGCYRHWDTPLRPILKSRRYPVRPTIMVAGWLIRLFDVDLKAFDRAAWAARMQVPSLFLHGEHDDLCAINSAREVAGAARDGAWVTFPQGGHLDLHEVDPRKYQNALRLFLDRLPKSETRAEPQPQPLECLSSLS